METPDKTIDVCKKCGKEIRYDQEDGYWDNLVNENGVQMWTPFNCIEKNQHEPKNHISDKNGYYYPTSQQK